VTKISKFNMTDPTDKARYSARSKHS